MKRYSHVLFLFIFIFHPFQGNSQTLNNAADSIRIIRGVPGMVYAVFSEDSILEYDAIGYREFKLKDRIDKSDRFNIGTNTAAFTAYIASLLVEKNKIKWSTLLLSVFPEFKKKAFPVYQSITFQDLLSSRSRIQAFMDYNDWFKIPAVKGNIIAQRKAFTGWMLQRKPNMENFLTDKIVFSLAGYIMAVSMMEKVTGLAWEDLLTEYVRKPLKISIHYSWPNLTERNAPAGHWLQGGYYHAEAPDTWIKGSPVLYPAHDITISMPDYIKFMQDNLAGLSGKYASLPRKSYEFMFFGMPDYALGWNNGSLNDQGFAFHEGISLLFNCRTEILKEKKIGIIVMCNAGDKDGRGAVLDLTKLLEEKYF